MRYLTLPRLHYPASRGEGTGVRAHASNRAKRGRYRGHDIQSLDLWCLTLPFRYSLFSLGHVAIRFAVITATNAPLMARSAGGECCQNRRFLAPAEIEYCGTAKHLIHSCRHTYMVQIVQSWLRKISRRVGPARAADRKGTSSIRMQGWHCPRLQLMGKLAARAQVWSQNLSFWQGSNTLSKASGVHLAIINTLLPSEAASINIVDSIGRLEGMEYFGVGPSPSRPFFRGDTRSTVSAYEPSCGVPMVWTSCCHWLVQRLSNASSRPSCCRVTLDIPYHTYGIC